MRPLLLIAAAAGLAPGGHLYLAGRDPGTATVVDVAAGQATFRSVPQLSGGDPPYMLTYTGGRLVVFALGRATSLDPALGDPRSLGEAWFFVPSATPGRVWTVQLKHGNRATRIAFRSSREVSVDDGRVTARGAAPPGWPLAAAGPDLVLQRGERLEAWDPLTRRARRLPGLFPLAAYGTLVASCARSCHAVHLTDVTTGRRSLVRGPFLESYEGAFSPDGRLLAVPAARGKIALVDVRRHTVRLIRGAHLPRYYALLSWSSSGWLFYNAGGGRLGAWRPGQPARKLPIRVTPFVDMVSD